MVKSKRPVRSGKAGKRPVAKQSAKTVTAKKRATVKKTTRAKKRAPVKTRTVKKTVKKSSTTKSVKKTGVAGAKRTMAKRVKTAAKRPVARQRITLDLYDMQQVPEEQHFYFVNGQRVKNVKELAEIMDRIEQEVFDYHVNEEKNDFYSWVKHVFNDLELAEKLVGVTGPKHLQFTIYKHVADKAMKKKTT